MYCPLVSRGLCELEGNHATADAQLSTTSLVETQDSQLIKVRAISPAVLAELLQLLEAQIRPADPEHAPMATTMATRGKALPLSSGARPKVLGSQPPASMKEAVSRFGTLAKSKLSNPAVKGQPEDQLRTPVERLLRDVAGLVNPTWRKGLSLVGETALSQINTRPDFAVTLANALVGFVEIKAPGKGADPRRFRDSHDKHQWERLRSLPNLIYTDGNEFSLWRYGELEGSAELEGDITKAGAALEGSQELASLVGSFLSWAPIPPHNAKQLAEISARLCRLLRDDVVEQLTLKNSALTKLAKDWRQLLFPDATDAEFADGYAQVVTFGMLVARAKNISLAGGLDRVGQELGPTLIGTALRVLTFGGKAELATSIGTLERVLDAIVWSKISKGDPEAWLYFYEDFLAVYDSKLRKQTGSYYTPPQVVNGMVRLVDELLRTRFSLTEGLASNAVTLIDPAVGTGTFLLGVLRKIASTVEADQGPGAVSAAIDAAVQRLLGFEVQLGPFAVAQLRFTAELTALIGGSPSASPQMFVTDTLANPNVEQESLPSFLDPIAESRRQANQIKKNERIMVVLGNPPYREKALGQGGWVEDGDKNRDGTRKTVPPLDAWIPPSSWGVSAHAKHLRNLYVYFWRWATWKVFDHDPVHNTGIVCFVSVAGFLNGPAFQKMRDYLRRSTDEIWVIDCSPEGHQPEVNTRLFEAVQQPICIVLACRSPQTDSTTPARVKFRSLPSGDRSQKLTTLASIALDGDEWTECPAGWREPFLPTSEGAWSTYLPIENLFAYNGSGVMPGRTWVIAPDRESLSQRWKILMNETSPSKQALLFHPHLQGDKTIVKPGTKGLAGHELRLEPVRDDKASCIAPTRYAFRSFDRQWIIPDNRLINRPNPTLWDTHSKYQVYLTAVDRTSPSVGPAFTFTSLIPDLDHYNGRGGRVFPLWSDREACVANVNAKLLHELTQRYGKPTTAEDLFAYVAAVGSHSNFTKRFQEDLRRPGIRIPITADAGLFSEAVALGSTIIWLQSFGERYVDPGLDRPARTPRLSGDKAPRIPKDGAISGGMPDTMHYNAQEMRLYIGNGYIDHVEPAVWNYEVSGKQVVHQWFSYRKANRERPIIGERRKPSPLGDEQPTQWPSEYTTELMNLLHVLSRLVEQEPIQRQLLDRICAGPTIPIDALNLQQAEPTPKKKKGKGAVPEQDDLPYVNR